MSPQLIQFSMDPTAGRPRFEMFGFGGAGCNLIMGGGCKSVAVGTVLSELERCVNSERIVLSGSLLGNLADTNPSMITLSHLPSSVGNALRECDVAVLFAGLGGATGSNGVRLFTSLARISGAMSMSVVSLPFSVESISRRESARSALSDLRERSDMLVVFENDKLTALAPNLPIGRTFALMNSIMERPVSELSKIMTLPDIPVLKRFSKGRNVYRLGIGSGSGVFRDLAAVKDAFTSPWFPAHTDSIKSAIVSVAASSIDRLEVEGAIHEVRKRVPAADILFGSHEDDSLGDKLIATLLISE